MIDQVKTAERKCRWMLGSHAATDKRNSSDVTMDHAEGRNIHYSQRGIWQERKEKGNNK